MYMYVMEVDLINDDSYNISRGFRRTRLEYGHLREEVITPLDQETVILLKKR